MDSQNRTPNAQLNDLTPAPLEVASGTGKWSFAGVPHKGWQCIGVEDLEEPIHVCEMCERVTVRYVHSMTHADYPGELRVGCVCSSHMEQDYIAPKKRELRLRTRTLRRQKWISRRWRVSINGDLFLTSLGYTITIFKRATKFRFTVSKATNRYFSKRQYTSSEEAQLAAFDAIWPKKLEKQKLIEAR